MTFDDAGKRGASGEGRIRRAAPAPVQASSGETPSALDLINLDVPQHVVQKMLDHSTSEMTAQYANSRELHLIGAFPQVAC
jgi:hypothetical protein